MTRGRLLVLLLFVGLLIFGGFLFLQYREKAANGPKGSAGTFVKALVAKDSGASYAYLSDNFKQSTTEEDWKIWVDLTFDGQDGSSKFLEELPVHEPDKSYPQGSTPVRYTYQYTLGGETFHFSLVLLKENGAWKVNSIGSIEK